jgi:hypothetical protein
VGQGVDQCTRLAKTNMPVIGSVPIVIETKNLSENVFFTITNLVWPGAGLISPL